MNNFYGMNPQINIDRINKQIDDLNNLKMQMQNPPQQAPINNYINTNVPKIEMEAKYLQKGQSINDIIIQNRTLFIDEENKKVVIKEEDGNISKEYEIIIPLTKEQKEIQDLKNTNLLLENKLKEMEGILNELNKSNITIKQNKQSNDSNVRNDEPTAKTNSK